MSDYDQIIVGAGASALTYLSFSEQKGTTAVFGGKQMWENMQAATHAVGASSVAHIGQPASLSHAPHKVGAPSQNMERLTMDQYNKDLQQVKSNLVEKRKSALTFANEKVSNIKRPGLKYEVTTNLDTHTAREVILASGPGGSRRTKGIEDAERTIGDRMNERGYKYIVGAEEYLFGNYGLVGPKRVVVNGGSATAAWAVKHALFMGANQIAWVTRSNFEGANPGGWNAEILLEAVETGMMRVGDVKAIELRDKELHITLAYSEDSKRFGALPLHDSFGRSRKEDDRDVRIVAKDQPVEIVADQFIYALGYDFGATWALVDAGIKNDIHPMQDARRRFSSDGTAVIALHDGQGFWLVGAGLYNGILAATAKDSGFPQMTGQDLGKKFQLIPLSFCRGAQPNEGIPSQIASIGAVTDAPSRNMVHDFNWNTANRRDIRWFLYYTYSRFHGEHFKDLEEVADKIIERRTKQLLPWKKEVFNVVAVECLRAKFGTLPQIPPPYPGNVFDPNNWGIDDLTALLVQRYYDRGLQESEADKIAAAVMNRQWPSERVLNPGATSALQNRTVTRRGTRANWSKTQFNQVLKDVGGNKVDGDTLR
jgi:hypothetical protein